MDNKDLCEHTKIRLIAAAIGHQQCTKTAAAVIPLPGTDRVVAFGTPAEVRRLLVDTTAAPLSATELDKLEALALAYTYENGEHWYCLPQIADGITYEPAANFITGFSPATALALIAQARAAQPAAVGVGELPTKPHTTYNGYSDGSEPLWTAEQMDDYARAAIATDRTQRQAPAARPTDDHLWDETIRDRDTYQEWADKLADAIAKHFDAYIGEHSNMNCPWSEALEIIQGYEDEKPLHFAALLPGPYYMDPPDGGSVSVLEQFRRMAEDAAQWRAHIAKSGEPAACEHCGTHLPLHLLTCPVAVKGMAEGKKKEAPEPLRQLLIDLSNNTYFCGLHLNDDTAYAGYLAAAERAEQGLIELFEQTRGEA